MHDDAKKDQVRGKAEQVVGDATGDDELAERGKRHETGGKIKEKLADVNEKLEDAIDSVEEKIDHKDK